MKKNLLAWISALVLACWSVQLSAQTRILASPTPFVTTNGALLHFPIFGSPIINATGTGSSTWQISGTGGPLFNVNSGALEAKDPTNASLIVLRGATPVGTTDLATKAYVDGKAGASTTGTGLWYTTTGTLNSAAIGFSGDGTLGALAGGNVPLTLATVNGNVGSFGAAATIPVLTLNAKGLVTAASNASVAITNANVTSGAYANITGTGTLTTGSTGAGFTLALGTSTLTGAVPDANQAAQNLTGNVGGTTAATVLNSISGASAISISQPAFTWTAAAGAPTLSQAAPTSDVVTTPFTLLSQPPWASAATNKKPANLVLATPAATAGFQPFIKLQNNGGAAAMWLGGYPAVGYENVPTIWLLTTGGTPGSSNWAISSDGSTYVNFAAPSAGGSVGFAYGGVTKHVVTVDGMQLGSTSISFGGGHGGVIGLTDATTVPTSNPAGGGVLYSSSGAGTWRGSGGAVVAFAGKGTNSGGSVLTELHDIVSQSITLGAGTMVYTTPAIAAGTSGVVYVDVVNRAVTAPTSGSIGDTSFGKFAIPFKHVSGTLTAMSTDAFANGGDGSMSPSYITLTSAVSGSTLIIYESMGSRPGPRM